MLSLSSNLNGSSRGLLLRFIHIFWSIAVFAILSIIAIDGESFSKKKRLNFLNILILSSKMTLFSFSLVSLWQDTLVKLFKKKNKVYLKICCVFTKYPLENDLSYSNHKSTIRNALFLLCHLTTLHFLNETYSTYIICKQLHNTFCM